MGMTGNGSSDGSSGSTKEAKNEEPVSRIWACVSANGIFALFWTLKMKKTLWWLLVNIVSHSVFMGLAVLTGYTVEIMTDTEFESGIEFEDTSALLLVLLILALMPLIYVPPIYFMWRWTTEFNTRIFGYKSKNDWKKAGSPTPVPKENWFDGK